MVLSYPRCYMGESGGAVKALASFYKVPADHIVGHNGLRSWRSALGTGDFYRVAPASGVRRLRPLELLGPERKELPFQVGDGATRWRCWSPWASSASSRPSAPDVHFGGHA